MVAHRDLPQLEQLFSEGQQGSFQRYKLHSYLISLYGEKKITKLETTDYFPLLEVDQKAVCSESLSQAEHTLSKGSSDKEWQGRDQLLSLPFLTIAESWKPEKD